MLKKKLGKLDDQLDKAIAKASDPSTYQKDDSKKGGDKKAPGATTLITLAHGEQPEQDSGEPTMLITLAQQPTISMSELTMMEHAFLAVCVGLAVVAGIGAYRKTSVKRVNMYDGTTGLLSQV